MTATNTKLLRSVIKSCYATAFITSTHWHQKGFSGKRNLRFLVMLVTPTAAAANFVPALIYWATKVLPYNNFQPCTGVTGRKINYFLCVKP